MSQNEFDVLIIGAGISGAALFYELARYTDIKNIALIEKYNAPATLNSKGTSNSQTIHCGDIETNYTFEKAKKVKRTADMIIKYGKLQNAENKFMFSHQKMALAVGDSECEYMKTRYEEFKELYPYIKFFDKTKIKEIEPRVALDENFSNDRPENIAGMGIEAGEVFTTVDYGKMSESLVEQGQKQGKNTLVAFNQEVNFIEKKDGGFYIRTTDYKEYHAKALVVNAGAHSLFLAHKLGVGLDKCCWPVAGSFYLTKQKLLNGKVYMVQNPKLPFAALHGDPDLLADMNTRFGPTALVLPKLERYHGLKSMPEFFSTLKIDRLFMKIAFDIMKDSMVRNYLLYNYLYEIPIFNRYLFVKNAKKIVPSLKPSDIYYADGFGGVRPQVIDRTKGEIMLGEASITDVEGVIFNMTPSPGATSCLGNAERDCKIVCKYLGQKFDEDKFTSELL
ncbi:MULTISPECIES: FAD-dependent oxidoreductase [unclassified Campylobacter]|uniref:FAD-dependent oxidoreductase n=1 Tax=unclassified Campylobacter TaxID=2593542 RepID=UPI001237D9D7|nr:MULTISPECIES: FAD-dependent oxidoreductase [unclassified Campylobacter]KAA6226482.1 FAD-dependent oxidoreductase [Campylobacter sp. LR185c]KAA6228617.1 FAD-dependent oxidoreductase [Campylobacter sp. LR196d]KAA6229170.1 FAD-dependent oxidoreductase [Campylobacter sp. LR286c]KAA6233961.1 FAD-dependent oxidoreductase [Campylobacter sp. LR291e]KAA6234200.1 FAD-dependent oxidoreductase [Campylobacter sp. LR264d]